MPSVKRHLFERFRRCLWLLWLGLLAPTVWADPAGELLQLAPRPNVTLPVFWLAQADAKATLVLLPGGAGSIGARQADGWPGSRNFLVRSGPLFAARGFNIAMVSHPSDMADLSYEFRTSATHLSDLHAVLVHLKSLSDKPIWVLGTSRGSISAAALAIAEQDTRLIDGLVLTSSITSAKKSGAVPYQKLDRIRVPVLLMQHEYDACLVCNPHEVPLILAGLKNAPSKQLILVNGGSNPTGAVCEALHWHGFINMEPQAVNLIADWIGQQ